MKNKVINSLIYALVIGIVCGIVGTAFNFAIKYIGVFRGSLPLYVQLIIMVALGPVIAGCYKWMGAPGFKATDGVVQAARDGQEFDIKVSPAAAAGLLLTCMAESAGCKEGGSFQIGAPIAHWIGRKLAIPAPERRQLTMCAIAAGFASVLGAPLFAAFIAAEVAFNKLEVKYLPYTAVSAAAAYLINFVTKAPKLKYAIDFTTEYGALDVLKLVVIAAAAGALGRFFLHLLGWTGKLTGKIGNPYIRIVAGGAIAAVVLAIMGTGIYLSAGNVIPAAIAGTGNWYDFILKIIFLAFLCKCGYKTGLLPQNITIGGAFGGTAALLLGVNPALGVAAGMVGIVGGVSCCPIAALALACDMFGFKGILLCALFAGVGTLCGGFHGYYSTKKAPVPEKTEEEKLQEKIAEVFDKK